MTIEEKLEALRINIESLHSNIHELFEASGRQLEQSKQDGENISKLLEQSRQDGENIRKLQEASGILLQQSRQGGENIRALARIAEIHERRLTALEGSAPE